MLDLSSKSSEFAWEWLTKYVIEQPKNDKSLTWFVSAARLYKDYANDSLRSAKTPLAFNDFWAALQLRAERVKAGKMRGVTPVYTGVRYFRDGVIIFGL